MKRELFTVFLPGLAALLVFALAYAATKAPTGDTTIFSSEVFKERKRGPVTFSHSKHKEIKCKSCHHEFVEGKNVWKEGDEVNRCQECHKYETQDDVPSLERAVHGLCLRCHKALKEEDKKSGPVECGKCHPKRR